VPLTSNAITYAEEEVRYILEIPEQTVQERILHAIRDDNRNEVDSIAQGLGANRDHVLVWLNRMVELGILQARRQELTERTPGGRGPARTFFEIPEGE
jgi:predicted transcriptional regulator